MSVLKYRRMLLKELPRGYTIRRVGGRGHPYLFDPNGELVRNGDGRPVTLAYTPSDSRALKNDLSLIRRALAAVKARAVPVP